MNDQMALIWCWFWFRFYFSQSCVSDRTMQRSYSTTNRQTSSPPRRRHWTTSSSATPNAVSSMTYYSLELFQHIFAETRKRRIFSFDVWYWQWHNRLRVPSDFFATFCLLFCSPAGILVHETSRYLWCHCSYLHRSLWSLNQLLRASMVQLRMNHSFTSRLYFNLSLYMVLIIYIILHVYNFLTSCASCFTIFLRFWLYCDLVCTFECVRSSWTPFHLRLISDSMIAAIVPVNGGVGL